MWIDINDRLPSTRGKYLVTLRVGSMTTEDIVCIVHYQDTEHNKKFLTGDWQTVIGWQELPEPMRGYKNGCNRTK